jgi:hypothetical protein
MWREPFLNGTEALGFGLIPPWFDANEMFFRAMPGSLRLRATINHVKQWLFVTDKHRITICSI